MTELTCDVAIIGAGTAGLAAERAARKEGASTLLIDDRFAGTTCTLVGCMPSKLLVAAADAAQAARRAGTFGITLPAPVIDDAAVLGRVRHERDRFNAGVLRTYAELPEGVKLQGKARFIGNTRLALDDGRQVSASAVVIATGAAPEIPKSLRGVQDRVLTNETIFDLTSLPKTLAVIGAGPMGLELAQAFWRLGVQVMVFDQGKGIGGLKDEAIAKEFSDILADEFPVLRGVELNAEMQKGGVALSWSGSAEGTQHFDYLLVAAGRPPRLEHLSLENTRLALDEHKTPIFNRSTMQCGDAPIFIAGDADHDRPVLHEASEEGRIAGRNAALFPKIVSVPRCVPFSIVFTDPVVAVIGQTADPDDPELLIGEASYADQGRAKVMARNVGLVRLYADRRDGRLTGAAMVGPGVEHTGHLLAWAIQSGLTATQLLEFPFYHPTVEEGMQPALWEICKNSGLMPAKDDVRLAGA